MSGYIGLFDTSRDYTLQFTMTHTHTNVHSHVFTSRCSLATSSVGRSPSSGFPNCPWLQLPASHINSLQQNRSTSLTQLTFTDCPAYNVLVRTARRTPFHYCCAVVAVEICLFATPLLINGCCITAFAVVA
jgi:hypothetical protein